MRFTITLILLLAALPAMAVDTVQIDRNDVTTSVPFTPAGIGALKADDYKVKNVLTLGVLNNGSDQWALMQSLIDTASAGDTFYFPKGAYGLSQRLVLPDNRAIRIMGDGMGTDTGESPNGTTFKALSSMTSVLFKNYTTGVIMGGEISNIAVDCNTVADVGIEVKAAKQMKLNRIKVLDFKTAGMRLGDTTSGGSSRMFYEAVISEITLALQAYKWPTPSTRADYGLHMQMTASDNHVSKITTANIKTAGVYDEGLNNSYSMVHPYGSPETYNPLYSVRSKYGGITIDHLESDGPSVGVKIDQGNSGAGNVAVSNSTFFKPAGFSNSVVALEMPANITNVKFTGAILSGGATAYNVAGGGTPGAGFQFNDEVLADSYGVGWASKLTTPTKKDVYDKIEALVASGGAVTSVNGATGAVTVAPADATYIMQTASSGTSNEQALSSLSTGFLKVTNGTGALTSDTSTYYKSGDYITATRFVGSGTVSVGSTGFSLFPTVENADMTAQTGTQKLNAAASYKAGLRVDHSIIPTEAHTTDFYMLLVDPKIKPNSGTSYNMNNLHGALFRLDLDSTYTGTVTNGYTVEIQPPNVNGGSGVITNPKGLTIGNFGTGAALSTGTGKVTFGDDVTAKTFTGTIPSATTYGATTTIDLSLGDSPSVTLTGNTTLAFSNPKAGQWHRLNIAQPSSGGTYNYTVTWPSTGLVCTWRNTASNAAPTLLTGANKVDTIIIHTLSTTSAECWTGGNK